jgi:phosphoserine phosphatase RsbU/P
LFRDGGYSSRTEYFSHGDKLVIYTDGLSETFNPGKELFGAERLSDLLIRTSDLAPKAVLEEILKELNEFRSGAPRTDDLTIMVLQRMT